MVWLSTAVLAAMLVIGSATASQAGDTEDCADARKLVKTDPERALSACRHLAEQGDAEAEYAIGYLYEKRKTVGVRFFDLFELYKRRPGVREDFVEAGKWYRHAAEHGSARAQDTFGTLLSSGMSPMFGLGEKDDVEAAKWYRQSAEQGYPEAQDHLGDMYLIGSGVPKDSRVAVDWYRKAAEQGYAGAQIALASMYQYGEGVPKDLVQAYVWFDIAALHASKKNDSEHAVTMRSVVAKMMTSSQIEEAIRLAREWKPRSRQ